MTPIADFYPMRLFGSKGIIVSGTQPLYDSQQLWVPLIAQARVRFIDHATFITKRFDGKQPRCVWHRLMIDADPLADIGSTEECFDHRTMQRRVLAASGADPVAVTTHHLAL